MFPSTHLSLLKAFHDPAKADSAYVHFTETYYAPTLQWSKFVGLKLHDAEDLTQDILIRMRHDVKSFQIVEEAGKPRGLFNAWLKKVIRNAAIDLVRKRQKEKSFDNEYLESIKRIDGDESIAQLSKCWEEASVRSPMMQEIIRKTKARVSEETWQMFEQVQLYNRNRRDVAADFGKSPGAVSKARQRVNNILRETFISMFGESIRD